MLNDECLMVNNIEDKRERAERIVAGLSEFSQNRIKQKEDLIRIIECTMAGDKRKLLYGVLSDAKFLGGLMNIVRRRDSAVDETLLRKYALESAEVINKLKNSILLILEEEGEFIMNIFKDKYFGHQPGAVARLYELVEELSWLKKYKNYDTSIV